MPFLVFVKISDYGSRKYRSTNEWSALHEALFSYDRKPILTTGFPTDTPEYIGQMAFDTINKLVYLANGLTAVSWQALTGGGDGGGGNDTILGIAAPAAIPARIGQLFIDTIGKNAYISTGATALDWEQIDFAGLAAVDWTDILNKPAVYPADLSDAALLTALNAKANTAELDTLYVDLAAKADIDHDHFWADIIDKPTTFTPAAHTHLWAQITDKPTAFIPLAHNHTWTEITGKPTTFTPVAHTHLWADITDKPATFTPNAHTHLWAQTQTNPQHLHLLHIVILFQM